MTRSDLPTALLCTLLIAIAGPRAHAQETAGSRSLTGVVRDSSGAVIANAVVVVRSGAAEAGSATTASDGRFAVSVPDPASANLVVIVRAAGFSQRSLPVPPGGAEELSIVLAPAGVSENVTVTATRTERDLDDVPASVDVIRAEDVRSSPALVADDVLRQTPAFSLFRRASSVSTHPTAQGVSLRGIGPSGVSRTLVLLDSVPANDPFGGWVYWSRVPLESIERIEVVNGGGSSLYGNYAMGGVINIITSRPSGPAFEIKPQAGNLDSRKVEAVGGNSWRQGGVVAEGNVFETGGFPIVPAVERGVIDNNSTVSFANASVKGDYWPNSSLSAFGRAGYFREERDNGKRSTFNDAEEANDTRWTAASGGVRAVFPDQSRLEARVFGDRSQFHSGFLAVPAPAAGQPARSVGRMTTLQTVPTTAFGWMTQWTKTIGRHEVMAGADGRRIEGESQEDGLDATQGLNVTVTRAAGGAQLLAGAFAQALIRPVPDLVLTISARVDRWRNFDGHNLETSFPTGTPTANHRPTLPDRTDVVVSPHAAALYHLTENVSIWGDVNSGFRAPTLNELYRSFSVGAVRTLANAELGPERLLGQQLGVNVRLGPLTSRTAWFHNTIRDAVANITVATNLQQRQNVGRIGVSGFQTGVEYRYRTTISAEAAYVYNRAIVEDFPANAAVVDKRLPQVPTHRGSFRVVYSGPLRTSAAIGVQFVGRQFDDDLNARAVPTATLAAAGYETDAVTPGLPGYALVDLSVTQRVHRRVELFVGAQNLLGRPYFVGTLPTTIGSPRVVSAGARIRLVRP